MIKQPEREHARKTTIVFDPGKNKDDPKVNPIHEIRVAAYARVSTDQEEQQSSYEAQIDYYTAYIAQHPQWEFVGVYADEGISGTNLKHRDGFNRMIADALAGKIDLILTKSISRFSRNTVDALNVTRELKQHNVEVRFEKEKISSMDPHAEMLFTVLCSIAQEESRSISENVRWGIQRSMENGKIRIPWKKFLGYEKGEDGLPKIVEEEAEIVRKIFTLFLQGDSYNRIAEKLMEENIPAPGKGEIWHSTTVRSILMNEKYKGDARLQKTYTTDFLKKERKKNRGEVKQWYVSDSHDAIISPETFELARREIERRSGVGRKYDSPFSGKIICGVCGAVFIHCIWYSNKPYRKEVWRCSSQKKRGISCGTHYLTDQDLKSAFKIAVKRQSGKGSFEHTKIETELNEAETRISELTAKEKQLKIEYGDLVMEMEKMLDHNHSVNFNQERFTKGYESLKNKLIKKKQIIETIAAELSDAQVRKQNLVFFHDGVEKLAGTSADFDIPIWHALTDHVTVMPDKTLTFSFRDGSTETVALAEVR